MMAGWKFFLAIFVSLQVAQDGVHSCTLRSHNKASGPQSSCSTPGAAVPTPAIPRRTPVSCATPTLGLTDALNKIPSISPVSFASSLSNPVPAAPLPPVPVPLYLTPVSASISGNERILIDLLLEYFATQEPPHRLPLTPLSSSSRGFTSESLPVLLTPTPYPAMPNLQISPAELQQFLSLLSSVSGPGSDLLTPAVPSDRLLPSLSPAPPEHVTNPPPAIATVPKNAMLEAAAVTAATAVATEAAATATATEATATAAATEATGTAPVNEPKSTPVPETAPTAQPNSVTDPADSVSTNSAVQTSDPGLANVPASAPINVPDSTFVAPSNTILPAADFASASTSDTVSSASPPSDITTPSLI